MFALLLKGLSNSQAATSGIGTPPTNSQPCCCLLFTSVFVAWLDTSSSGNTPLVVTHPVYSLLKMRTVLRIYKCDIVGLIFSNDRMLLICNDKLSVDFPDLAMAVRINGMLSEHVCFKFIVVIFT